MFKKHKNQELDMSFLWKKNPKSPSEYIKYSLEQINKLNMAATIDNKRKSQDELLKYLVTIKEILLNEMDSKANSELENGLHLAMNKMDFFYELLSAFEDLTFEIMKEVLLLFAISLAYTNDNKFVTVDYYVANPKTISYMLRKVEIILQPPPGSKKIINSHDMFLIVGNMILEAIKYGQLCRIIINDSQFYKFFTFAIIGNFEISTESFQILYGLFISHEKLISTEFFSQESNILRFIQNINKLMAHGNYVTKRQSTKLMSELIIIKSNNQLMNTYINSPENVKLIMTLMTDKSKNLQIEAFNIFKVIVANPRKSKPVLDILIKNRDNLLKYFETFGTDIGDSIFIDERGFVIQGIESLPRIMSSNIESSSNPSSQSLPTI